MKRQQEQLEMKNMNTKNILIAAFAGVALTITASFAQAESKGATKLIQLNQTAVATAPAAVDYKAMSCGKCQDSSVAAVDRSAKGATLLAGAATKTVTTHACPTCADKLTAGAGKHDPAVTTHTCAMNVACCK
jgi:hypothetical protein